MCVMFADTLCVKRIVLKMSDVLFHSLCHVVALVVMSSMQMWTWSCWNLIYRALSICLSYY